MFNIINRFRGHGYKTKLQNPHDAYWDYRLGVDTFGFHPATGNEEDPHWRVHYAPTPYDELFRLLELVRLNSNDVFVDLGAGLGRAPFVASYMGAKRAVGVDIVSTLCAKANSNLQRSGLSQSGIEIVCMDAALYPHQDTTILFMAHPFGLGTFEQVLRNLERDVRRGGLRIIYRNPIYASTLERLPWLKLAARVPPRRAWPSTFARYETLIWETFSA